LQQAPEERSLIIAPNQVINEAYFNAYAGDGPDGTQADRRSLLIAHRTGQHRDVIGVVIAIVGGHYKPRHAENQKDNNESAAQIAHWRRGKVNPFTLPPTVKAEQRRAGEQGVKNRPQRMRLKGEPELSVEGCGEAGGETAAWAWAAEDRYAGARR
jgi:hypothetical protein